MTNNVEQRAREGVSGLDAAREVLAEMRERKINHGRDTSPTLVAWADRIERAITTPPSDAEQQQQAPDGWVITYHWNEPKTEFTTDANEASKYFDGKYSNVTVRPVFYTAPPSAPVGVSDNEVFKLAEASHYGSEPNSYWDMDRAALLAFARTLAQQPEVRGDDWSLAADMLDQYATAIRDGGLDQYGRFAHGAISYTAAALRRQRPEARGVVDGYDPNELLRAAMALIRRGHSIANDPGDEVLVQRIADHLTAAQLRCQEQQQGQRNPWQEAVDRERVSAHLGIAADGVTCEEAARQLAELIDWHVKVATDPAVNGGLSLQPAQQQGQACTCPSGDGSLRWPCPAHPPVKQRQAVAPDVVGYIVHSGTEVSRFEATQAALFLGVGKHAVYTAPPPSVPDLTEAMIEAGRTAVMAIQCSGPKWTIRQHYEASGKTPSGIPDALLDAPCPLPKAARAELIYRAMLAAAPRAKGVGNG